MDKEVAKRTGKQSKESRGGMRQQVSGSPLSSRLVTEKVMRDVHRVMQGREFQSIEEANAFLARLAGPGLKEALKKVPSLSPQQEAQELAYRSHPHAGPHSRPRGAGEGSRLRGCSRHPGSGQCALGGGSHRWTGKSCRGRRTFARSQVLRRKQGPFLGHARNAALHARPAATGRLTAGRRARE